MECKEKILNARMRSEIALKVEDLSNLFNSKDDSYLTIKEERHHKIKPVIFLNDDTVVEGREKFKRKYFRIPEITFSVYHDACILPTGLIKTKKDELTQDGFEEFIVDSDNSWFGGSFFSTSHGRQSIPRASLSKYFIKENKFRIDLSKLNKIELNRPVISLTAWHHSTFCHWLMDIYSRIWILEKIGFKEKPLKNINIVLLEPILKYQQEMLNFIGIDNDRIIKLNTNSYISSPKVFVPSRLCSQYDWISPELIEFYQSMRRRFFDFNYRNANIYLSRKDANNKRELINYEKLEKKVKKLGFDIIIGSKLNWKERCEIFSSAKMMVSEIGSGAFCSVMMPSESMMIISGTPEMHRQSVAMQNIASISRLECRIFSGQNITRKDPVTDSWEINIENFIEQICKGYIM